MEFCTTFDAQLAASGPPGVFLRDPEGAWRFDASWTRDLYGRAAGPHPMQPGFVLVRDQGNHFVTMIHLTSKDLLKTTHPRLDCRWFDDLEQATAVLDALGSPPLRSEPWA